MSEANEQVSILLVDDRPGNLLSLTAILDRPDYRLVTASSGEEALSLVLKEEFALILMDVAMPGMDGFEVATTLKQRERFRTIPIIFVTASVQQIEWIFKAYSVGAVDFLNKPLDPHAVRAKVEVFVELYRQKRQLKRHAEKLKEIDRREREVAISALRLESERRYRNLAEAIPHVVWTADPQGRVTYFNRRWSELTGRSDGESLGTAWQAAVHGDDAERLTREWEHGIEGGVEFQSELRLRAADGSYCWYLLRALPEPEGHGAPRWMGTLTDVDAQKRAQEELQSAITLRDEFVSVASHELRTPLTALQLQLQGVQRLLQKAQGDAFGGRMAKKLGTAVQQTDRLARLIDSLLDVSRIARGKLELQLEEFDLAEVTRDVAERFHEEALRKGSEIRLDAPDPVVGRWDRLRIEQVITNLLSNSMKYASGKPIHVEVEPDGGGARLTVRDQGIGIEPEKLERIFERFERGVSSRHYGGLGLGLYIVRRIVDAHGGEVRVDSHPGAGSRFDVLLPIRPAGAREVSFIPESAAQRH